MDCRVKDVKFVRLTRKTKENYQFAH